MFNYVNGYVIVCRDFYKDLADYLGVEVGAPQAVALVMI